LLGSALAAAASAPAPEPSLPETAGALLARRCLTCHGPGKASGGLDLSTRAAALKDRAAGAALAPRRPEQSRLSRLAAAGRPPPPGRRPPAEIALLRRRIAAGGESPAAPLPVPPARPEPLWSLQPVRLPPVPKTNFDRLARSPVDHFLFAALEKA